MTVGKREMKNITVGKRGGGCSTNDHMTVEKEGGAGWRGREKGERERGGGGGGGGRRGWQTCLVWAHGLNHGP